MSTEVPEGIAPVGPPLGGLISSDAVAGFPRGTVLVGRYRIIGLLGRGGMGEVFRAQDLRLERDVAVKVLGHGTGSLDALERFRREARAIGALQHPNICTIFDVGQLSEHQPFIVMELLDGETLQQRLALGPFEPERVVELGVALADALETAHRAGIIHRDIKPANILLCAHGPKLLDFGLAKQAAATSDVTRTFEGVVRGTVPYMSPEQANAESIDARSDIFSFGAVLYEMLAGHRAFGGETPAQIISAILRDIPAPFEAPSDLERIVRRLLEKQPRHRFQNMAEVKAALQYGARQHPIRAVIHDRRPSIAVLPFANLGGDAEQEYFADGVSEDIVTELSRFRSLFVIARNSSFTYRGKAVDVRQVARELGVRYVVEGTVRRAGTRVRVTAELIDATDGHQVWADRYDRELSDMLAVQDEITRSIVGSIAPGITQADLQRARRKDPAQLDAWDKTLRARWHMLRFTREDCETAVHLLDAAIAEDPTNAAALSDLVFALHFASIFGWSASPASTLVKMADMARRALAADDLDAAAHAAMGISGLFLGNHDEAVRRLGLATNFNPYLSLARGYLGVVFAFGGDRDRALLSLEEALRLSPRDPLRFIWYTAAAWAHLSAEDYELAIAAARNAIDCNAEFPDGHVVRAAASGLAGHLDEARLALAELVRRMPGLTVRDGRLNRPFKKAADQERLLTGLRAAGLPA